MFDNATLLITGGTGSFGEAVLQEFLRTNIREVRIFSRDEKKQDDIRKRLNHPKLKFYLGDVRDYRSVKGAMAGVDLVLHAAALKQVPSCEFHPMEVVKTNVLGAENVFEAAIHCRVAKVVCLSTDKAVYPINAMGMSKALMEKIMVAKARVLDSGRTALCATRYGNVMGTRGSVIPLFIERLLADRSITVTEPRMTRFMLTMEQAVRLVTYAIVYGENGDLLVHKAPAATLETLTEALLQLYDRPAHPVEIIGTRHGEKLYETLLSREERAAAESRDDFFRLPPDPRDLNYEKFVEEGEPRITESEDYTSHNTRRLDVEQTRSLLFELDFVRATVPRPAVMPMQ